MERIVYPASLMNECDRLVSSFVCLSQVLQEQPRFLTTQRTPAANESKKAVLVADASAAPAPPAVSPIEAVKMILPDLGEGFIQACLAAFNNNPDEVVARVLENNLPPKLAAMSRDTGEIWMGKRDSGEKDQAFIAKQRERMRAMERQEEMNYHLVTSFEREYDDDYDDQVTETRGCTFRLQFPGESLLTCQRFTIWTV